MALLAERPGLEKLGVEYRETVGGILPGHKDEFRNFAHEMEKIGLAPRSAGNLTAPIRCVPSPVQQKCVRQFQAIDLYAVYEQANAHKVPTIFFANFNFREGYIVYSLVGNENFKKSFIFCYALFLNASPSKVWFLPEVP